MENSSGNVFADLGLPHPEQELLKAKLTLRGEFALEGRLRDRDSGGRLASGGLLSSELFIEWGLIDWLSVDELWARR